jgi:hypothetical protein
MRRFEDSLKSVQTRSARKQSNKFGVGLLTYGGPNPAVSALPVQYRCRSGSNVGSNVGSRFSWTSRSNTKM